jgi:hypothetical protein
MISIVSPDDPTPVTEQNVKMDYDLSQNNLEIENSTIAYQSNLKSSIVSIHNHSDIFGEQPHVEQSPNNLGIENAQTSSQNNMKISIVSLHNHSVVTGQNVIMEYHLLQNNLEIENAQSSSQNNMKIRIGSLHNHSDIIGEQSHVEEPQKHLEIENSQTGFQNNMKIIIQSPDNHSDSIEDQSQVEQLQNTLEIQTSLTASQNDLISNIGSLHNYSDLNPDILINLINGMMIKLTTGEQQNVDNWCHNFMAQKDASQNILKNSNGSQKSESDYNEQKSNYYSNETKVASSDVNAESVYNCLSKSTSNETSATNHTIINSGAFTCLVRTINEQSLDDWNLTTAHSMSVNNKSDNSLQIAASNMDHSTSVYTKSDTLPKIISLSKSTNNETSAINHTIINSGAIPSLVTTIKEHSLDDWSLTTAHSTSVNTKFDISLQIAESHIFHEYSELTDKSPVITDNTYLCTYYDTEKSVGLDLSSATESSYFSKANINVFSIN